MKEFLNEMKIIHSPRIYPVSFRRLTNNLLIILRKKKSTRPPTKKSLGNDRVKVKSKA